jgi:unsaturated chondroitin disaccharide hydrolase
MGVQDAWEVWLMAARRELERSRQRPATEFPHFSENGRWRLLDVRSTSRWDGDIYEHGNWTAGFWFGVMWLLAAGARDEEAAAVARERLRWLLPRAHDTTTHDLGFLFFPSVALGRLLGLVPDDAERAGLDAAGTLARRFNPRGDYIQAFGPIGDPRSAGTSTVDTMMNLPLLWWAASRGGDPSLFDTARWHARTSARLFLRPDGSTYHLNHFDPLSGAILHRGTFQGASDRSCWSRGQAWVICGFAWAFAAAGEPEFLTVADETADWFWRALPDDAVPPWDFADDGPGTTRDASAAAIAALGAVILAQVHHDPGRRHRYAELASQTLDKVAASCLNDDPERDGILLHSCYSKPHGLGLDGATGWGDFFLGLALAAVTGALALPTVLGRRPGDEHSAKQPRHADTGVGGEHAGSHD